MIKQITINSHTFTVVDKNGDGVLRAEEGDNVFEGTHLNSSHFFDRVPTRFWNGFSVNAMEKSLGRRVAEKDDNLSFWKTTFSLALRILLILPSL